MAKSEAGDGQGSHGPGHVASPPVRLYTVVKPFPTSVSATWRLRVGHVQTVQMRRALLMPADHVSTPSAVRFTLPGMCWVA